MLQPRKAQVLHPAVEVAEIVEEILQALVDFGQDPGSRRRYAQLQPCLTVSRLWHACAARILWREVTIDEGHMPYAALLRFASLLSPLPDLTASSSTSTMDTDDGNEPSDAMAPMPQPNSKRSGGHGDPKGYRDFMPPSLHTVPHHAPPNKHPQAHMALLPAKTDEVYRRYQDRGRRIPYETMVRTLSIIKMKQANVSEPVAEIGRAGCHIEQLNIYICDHLENYAITPFLQHGRLTHLSLAGCHKITDSLILDVAALCPQLEHLDLRACGRVSDVSISAVARQCPRLAHLNVGRVNDRHRITSESIRWVARHTRVAVLGLAGCDIDDETMVLLAKHRNRSLERLSINSCHRISNATLRACVEHCPNISVFEMRECHLINDWEAIYELSKRKVVLTLCKQQERACGEWARRHGKNLNLRLARAT